MTEITYHPRLTSQGKKVRLLNPHQASDPSTWENSEVIATFTPDCSTPPTLNGCPVESLLVERADLDFSKNLGSRVFTEPRFSAPSGYKSAAGAIVLEPDGRVWVVHPSNGFGGYQTTFPKGTLAKHGSLRETAVREVYEESGLVVELFAYLADSTRTQSHTRYYLARRITGNPSSMGWESQAVSLVPLNILKSILNQPIDHPLVDRLVTLMSECNFDHIHCDP